MRGMRDEGNVGNERDRVDKADEHERGGGDEGDAWIVSNEGNVGERGE